MDSIYGDNMFDSEDIFDMNEVYKVPMGMVIYMRDRAEPLFAEHVFFFQKEDPLESLEQMMNFAATWWDTISEDKNLKYMFLTDAQSNKKAILLKDVVAISFMTPEKPEWMKNGQDDSNSD